MAKPVIGLATGLVSGVSGAIADVVEKVAASIVLGPEASAYFSKRRINECLGVIMQYLSQIADREERENAVQYMWTVTQQHIDKPDKEEKSSVAWEIGSRTAMPVIRGLGAALQGVFRTLQKAYADSDPIWNKRHNRVGDLMRSDNSGCMNDFAKLLTAMKSDARKQFFERLKKEVAYLNDPSWKTWYSKNFG